MSNHRSNTPSLHFRESIKPILDTNLWSRSMEARPPRSTDREGGVINLSEWGCKEREERGEGIKETGSMWIGGLHRLCPSLSRQPRSQGPLFSISVGRGVKLTGVRGLIEAPTNTCWERK
ncbi:hypothetical protein NPIL_235601 [Nephila pilipes]|uniref:Uncharacterized protein n=1 Tax=Nephila pilipes TaxID=299642 RepID=A0A8X6J063_NEPPI|nr:hypothetical protein NPIL_235601 [Nephila pilipes]